MFRCQFPTPLHIIYSPLNVTDQVKRCYPETLYKTCSLSCIPVVCTITLGNGHLRSVSLLNPGFQVRLYWSYSKLVAP